MLVWVMQVLLEDSTFQLLGRQGGMPFSAGAPMGGAMTHQITTTLLNGNRGLDLHRVGPIFTMVDTSEVVWCSMGS